MEQSRMLISGSEFDYLPLEMAGQRDVATLPFSLKILLENLLRCGRPAHEVSALVRRTGAPIGFTPSRLILQDMLGLPLLVDIVAMRDKVTEMGGDPSLVEPQLPVDMVVDHSMTVFHFATPDALVRNQEREFEVNRERFAFMRQCERLFANLRVIPPSSGIIHQINIENLATCVVEKRMTGRSVLSPDTVLGTDSHTPMVNGLGVLGWGIGGLDAEAIMFGTPIIFNAPRVVGVRVTNRLSENVTATDLALHVCERLRKEGVVGQFVEFFGVGLDSLVVTDRGTVANMAPEYGATCVYFPIDSNTLDYLRATGRRQSADLVEPYARKVGLWRDGTQPAPEFDRVIDIDLSRIRRSISAPRRPEQRLDLGAAKDVLRGELGDRSGAPRMPVEGKSYSLGHGDVVIAAITSCTNTANPHNMVTAGLLARNAVRRGLKVKPWIKTSLAPGSRVVAAYLKQSGLQCSLDALGFNVVGFACTTCNGMSGPLEPEIEDAIRKHDLVCAAVLSGNRNFEGRIHELSSLNVLASPPLVVAYALAGTVLIDIENEVIAADSEGLPVRLADLWPTRREVEKIVGDHVTEKCFVDCYASLAEGTEHWRGLPQPELSMSWDERSTNVRKPPFFDDLDGGPEALNALRPLVILGDSITTDHLSPAGYIPMDSAAAEYLIEHGVTPDDFNSFGTRRGNWEIVVRSMLANTKLRNEMVPGKVGSWTRLEPEGTVVRVFEAIEAYRRRGEKLIIVAGASYGSGSSRDTAAKAPWLAGVRVVLAESYERIHRSNLLNMGILPLQFPKGVNRMTLNLDGSEIYSVTLKLDGKHAEATLGILRSNGVKTQAAVEIRLDTPDEVETWRKGGFFGRFMQRIALDASR